MILRYFYIDKYNEITRNLDINLGGKYKYQYHEANNELLFIRNETYIDNLYEEYDVISDVSAILGKNSAGKTTILRMINTIFNGFDIYSKEKYIIIFEKERSYILYTNYMHIKYDERMLDKKIQCIKKEYFDAIDILKEVGLIYFSNVFDRATPFQGNANLIDVSANYLFEYFYMDYINGRMKSIDEKSSILEEYKSENILTEIDFLLDIKRTTVSEETDLLFDIPAQIEFGFSQVLPDSGGAPLCDHEEYNQLLREIYKSLENYLGENQESEGESVSLFLREIIFYLFCTSSHCEPATRALRTKAERSLSLSPRRAAWVLYAHAPLSPKSSICIALSTSALELNVPSPTTVSGNFASKSSRSSDRKSGTSPVCAARVLQCTRA